MQFKLIVNVDILYEYLMRGYNTFMLMNNVLRTSSLHIHVNLIIYIINQGIMI